MFALAGVQLTLRGVAKLVVDPGMLTADELVAVAATLERWSVARTAPLGGLQCAHCGTNLAPGQPRCVTADDRAFCPACAAEAPGALLCPGEAP